LANKKGNPQNLKPVRSVNEARKKGKKGGKASGASRRRHKTLQEITKEVSKLPLNDIGINKLKRSGIDINSMDPYDLVGLTAVVVGQMNAAANGNSQAAQVFADWMDWSDKHKKDQLEIEKLKAEIERLKADTERIRSGQGIDDDDQVLQFIEGMKHHDTVDAEAD